MSSLPAPPPEVFSPAEIARAARVPVRLVSQLVRDGTIATADGEFISQSEAVRVVRALRSGRRLRHGESAPLFRTLEGDRRASAAPLLASGALHVVSFAVVALVATLSTPGAALLVDTTARVTPLRLIFLAQPGPGGGGGGGGARQPEAPPPARRQGPAPVSSPVPVRPPPPPVRPASLKDDLPRPLLENEPLPPVLAPVVSVAGDRLDRIGLVDAADSAADSRGAGSAGGVGNGTGTGRGEGRGSGIGLGWGGGTGGGPYRPGAGIDPPRLLHEIRPRYTEEARRAGIEGEVLLEVVVRSDGTVGAMRVLRPLGSGLDERAMEAVGQWRFEPARRLGSPVDVMVEVAVEFRVR